MIDFITQFKDEHDEKLQNIWTEWRDNEYAEQSQNIEAELYENKKKELWTEWQLFLGRSLKSFHIFMKMRYKKIVQKSLSNMIMNEMDIKNKGQAKYFDLWNLEIGSNAEIERFLEYHKE